MQQLLIVNGTMCLSPHQQAACTYIHASCFVSSLQVPSHSTDKPFDDKVVKNWYMFVCIAVGLWGGLLIGLQTEYFTSNRYKPVQVRGVREWGM